LARTARQGIAAADLGGTYVPPETFADDSQLGTSVLGVTTGSDKPAETRIDRNSADNALAATDGGPESLLGPAGSRGLKSHRW
jgi:hypothetical protein